MNYVVITALSIAVEAITAMIVQAGFAVVMRHLVPWLYEKHIDILERVGVSGLGIS